VPTVEPPKTRVLGTYLRSTMGVITLPFFSHRCALFGFIDVFGESGNLSIGSFYLPASSIIYLVCVSIR